MSFAVHAFAQLLQSAGLDIPRLLLIAGVVLFAAFLRGLTGFGFAIAAVPLFSGFMDPKLAVGISTLLQLSFAFTDAPSAWKNAHTRSLPWLVGGALIGTPAGMIVLRVLPQSAERLIIALAAVMALVVVWRGNRAGSRWVTSNPFPVGIASGLLNGFAAMPGPPVIVFFLGASFDAVAARASLIVFFAATAIFASLAGLATGVVNSRSAVLALVCMPVLMLGNALGRARFDPHDTRLYRAAGLAVLAASAATAAWKGLSGFF